MGASAIKITEKWQFTIPVHLRKKLGIKPGDYLEPEVKKGMIVLKPRQQILVDPDQAWFWTSEWQKKEQEVEEDIRLGKIKKSKNVKEFIKTLRED